MAWRNESRRHSLARRGIKTRQRINPTIVKGVKNKKMSPEIYKLRRKVMNIIYDLKKIDPDMERVEVRIADDNKKGNLASARMDEHKVIWVTEEALNLPENDLRYIIAHELLHTMYGYRHKNSGLMSPKINQGWSRQKIESRFAKRVKESKERNNFKYGKTFEKRPDFEKNLTLK